MFKPEFIVLHHSATKDSGLTVSWGGIRNYHLVEKQWRDVGYHYGIEDVHGHYEILLGRMVGEEGAHCIGMNKRSIGICCVGNFDLDAPEDKLWQTCMNLVRHLMAQHKIPSTNVLGHRECTGYDRTCPGKFWNMGLFRSLL